MKEVGMSSIWTYRDETLDSVELDGFEVHAIDGPIGTVERIAAELSGTSLVVRAASSFARPEWVLLPAGVVDAVDLDAQQVLVGVTRDEIRNAPAYEVWGSGAGER
jgi:hypothetical protein